MRSGLKKDSGVSKSPNKSQLRRQLRRKYKTQAEDANDIFELNSPSGVGCLESALQERLRTIIHGYRDYGLRSEGLILGVLPYVVTILESVGNLKLKMSIKSQISNETEMSLFQDILRIEELFGADCVGGELGLVDISLSGLRVGSPIRLKNVEMAITGESTLDLVFDLPESIIESKDYINYAYFLKRGAVVVDMYHKLAAQVRGNKMQKVAENDARRVHERLFGVDSIVKLGNGEYPVLLPKESIQGVQVEIDYLHDLGYIPVVSVVVSLASNKDSKSATITQCRFRVLPSIPETSKLNKESVLAFRNCVRRSSLNYDIFSYDKDQLNPGLLPPTPQYNGAFLSEIRGKSRRELEIAEKVLSSQVLEEALMLLKLWCIRWKIWDGMRVDGKFRLAGQLNEEILLFLLFHTLEVNKDKLRSRKTSSFQIFRVVLAALHTMITNWRSNDDHDQFGTYYIIGDQSPKVYERMFMHDKDFRMTNLMHLFNRDYIGRQVFILSDEEHNVFWRCQDLVKEELAGVLNKTLMLIENKTMHSYAESVSDMFSLGVDFERKIRLYSHDQNKALNDTPLASSLLEFDSCIMISYPHAFKGIQLSYLIPPNNSGLREISLGDHSDPNTIRRGFDSVWENGQGANLVEITRRILARSFTDRVKVFSLREIISRDRFGCIIGVQFVPSVTRSIDKGPSIDTLEAKQFKEFWGSEKIETRRFKDGSVLETILWKSENDIHNEFLTNKGINQDILRYILSRHLPNVQFESKINQESGLVTYSMTPFGSIRPYSSLEKNLHEEFSNFKSTITGLSSLPLSIKSIQTSSSALRFMKYISSRGGEETPREEVHCVMEMEQSNKWPKTKESIKKIKIAFLLSIQKELGELHSITCDIIPDYESIEGTEDHDLRDSAPFLDIYWNEDLTFRLSIFHQAELERIASVTIDLDGISEKVIEENTRSPGDDIGQLRNLWWKSHVGARLLNLSNYFPSLRGSVKKLKHFASVNRIPDTEEFLEHVAAYVYTNNDLLNNVYDVPSTPTTGFLRSLWLISRFDWEKRPLIVDLDFQITEDSEKSRISQDDFQKLDKIHSIYYNFTKKHKLSKSYFYVSSLYDPQSLLIKLPSHYNCSRLVHFAKLYINIIVNRNSFNLPIREIKSSFTTPPKCDIVLDLQKDFISLVQHKSKKMKLNSLVLKKQYVNLSSTQELLSSSNLKGSPHSIAREIFDNFISDIKSLWNHQVDLIYDSYATPYPDKVYIKVRTSQFYPAKITESPKKNFLPGCMISYPEAGPNGSNMFVIPNLPLILSTIWSKYSGLITDIKL
ncbi:NRAP like nucleolar RNA associated protein [Cryptosporidium canis]|uniref:NRAP like nucleolar RNA associated protein n=1 Tax=Cryptosporidium canis TaxID=195482 RepID=A0A9D5HYV1_9CRYT|nr:NRAP like nucleolar RNA associated protein [Cryptosporidium canis]